MTCTDRTGLGRPRTAPACTACTVRAGGYGLYGPRRPARTTDRPGRHGLDWPVPPASADSRCDRSVLAGAADVAGVVGMAGAGASSGAAWSSRRHSGAVRSAGGTGAGFWERSGAMPVHGRTPGSRQGGLRRTPA
nr:hypothetical protein StreXyl84_33030 [Streptomyces sp. Xyl84]